MPYSLAELSRFSVSELDQVIHSERHRLLMDSKTLSISPDMLLAFSFKKMAMVRRLEEALESAGKTGLMEARASCLPCPDSSVSGDIITQHQQIVEQMTRLTDFIIGETAHLIKSKAGGISSDYLEASTRLEALKIDEIKTYLRMTPEQRPITDEAAPLDRKLPSPASFFSGLARTESIGRSWHPSRGYDGENVTSPLTLMMHHEKTLSGIETYSPVDQWPKASQAFGDDKSLQKK